MVMALDGSNQHIASIALSKTVFLSFASASFEATVLDLNSTGFTSIVLFLEVLATSEAGNEGDLRGAEIAMATLAAEISLAAVILIAAASFVVSVFLVAVISRRVRPSALGQWFSLGLCGALVIVDGPWLLCQFFAFPIFSTVYDLMLEVFHILFI
jgi:hypothetical protein